MPKYCPSKVLQIIWEEGLFLFPQVPHHLRSLHQLAACCSNSLVNLDCLVNYKHISKSFFLAFFLEWVTATPQLTEWSSMVFSQGSGRNMPHRDLIIYQHNVGFKPMRHQYIFLWSLTYCLLLSMLFSWLADKITVAVSKFTSNWSQGEKNVLRLVHLTDTGLILLWGAEGEVPGWGTSVGLCQPRVPALESALPHTYLRNILVNSWHPGYKQRFVTRSSAHFHDVLDCLLLPLIWKALRGPDKENMFCKGLRSQGIAVRLLGA